MHQDSTADLTGIGDRSVCEISVYFHKVVTRMMQTLRWFDIRVHSNSMTWLDMCGRPFHHLCNNKLAMDSLSDNWNISTSELDSHCRFLHLRNNLTYLLNFQAQQCHFMSLSQQMTQTLGETSCSYYATHQCTLSPSEQFCKTDGIHVVDRSCDTAVRTLSTSTEIWLSRDNSPHCSRSDVKKSLTPTTPHR